MRTKTPAIKALITKKATVRANGHKPPTRKASEPTIVQSVEAVAAMMGEPGGGIAYLKRQVEAGKVAQAAVDEAEPGKRKPVRLDLRLDAGLVRNADALAQRTGETFDQLIARAVVHLQKVTAERSAAVSLEADVADKLETLARAEGITAEEFLDQMVTERAEMLPIYFPAADVRLIRELCEAGGVQTGDDLAREMIGNIAKESLDSATALAPHRAYGVLDAFYNDEEEGGPDLDALARMQEVVDAWNADPDRHLSEPKPTALRPIYFPAQNVELLEELVAASGFGTVEDYAAEFLATEITDSLACKGGRPTEGVPLILAGSYQLEAKHFAAMQDVIDRWNTKAAAEGRADA